VLPRKKHSKGGVNENPPNTHQRGNDQNSQKKKRNNRNKGFLSKPLRLKEGVPGQIGRIWVREKSLGKDKPDRHTIQPWEKNERPPDHSSRQGRPPKKHREVTLGQKKRSKNSLPLRRNAISGRGQKKALGQKVYNGTGTLGGHTYSKHRKRQRRTGSGVQKMSRERVGPQGKAQGHAETGYRTAESEALRKESSLLKTARREEKEQQENSTVRLGAHTGGSQDARRKKQLGTGAG